MKSKGRRYVEVLKFVANMSSSIALGLPNFSSRAEIK